MSKNKIITIFFCFLGLISSARWNGAIYNSAGVPLEFYTINKGFYTPLRLIFTPQGTQTVDEVTLTLPEDSSFKLLGGELKINTLYAYNYTFYIGLACGSRLPEGSNYTLDFKLSTSDTSAFSITHIPLKVGTTVGKIAFEKTSDSLPRGGTGYFYFKNELYNMEPFEIEFTPKTVESSKVDKVTLEAFTESRTPNTENYFKFYSLIPPSKRNSLEEYTYAVKSSSMSTCLSIEDDSFSFTVTEDPLPKVSEKKEEIIKSIKVKQVETSKNSIEFDFEPFPVSPAALTCVAQSYTYGTEFPSNEEIRNYKKLNKNAKFSYIHKMITKTENIKVVISDLSRFENFRVKCVVDNTDSDESILDTVDFTIGNFPDSNVEEELQTRVINSEQLCATWEFEDFVNVDLFTSKFSLSCNNELLGLFGQGYEFGGCLSCQRINISQDKSKTEICVIPKENCPTDASFVFSQRFNLLANRVDTTDKIKSEYGLENFKLKNAYINDPSIKTETDSIKVKLINKGIDNFAITVENANKYDVSCYPKLLRLSDKVSKFLFDFSEDNKMTIKANAKHDIHLDFRDKKFEYDLYPLYFLCHRADFAFNKKDLTSPFYKFSFFYTNQTREDDPKKERPDCSKDIFHPECIGNGYHNLPKIESPNYGISTAIAEELLAFKTLGENDKRIYLDLKKELLNTTESNEGTDKLITITYLAALLAYMDCNEFRNYDICIEYKVDYMKNIINIFKDINVEELTLVAKNFHQYLAALFFILDNPDTITKDTFGDLEKIYDTFFNKYELYFTNQTDEYIKADSARIIFSITSNLIDLVHFGEYYGYITGDLFDESTIQSDIIVKYKNYIQKAADLYYTYTKGEYFTTDNFALQNIKLQSNEEEEVTVLGSNVTLKYDKAAISKVFPGKELVIIFYKKYPFVSLRNKKYWNSFIGLNFYEKDKNIFSQPALDGVSPLPQLIFANYTIGNTLYNMNEKKLDETKSTSLLTESTLTSTIKSLGDFTIGPKAEPKKEDEGGIKAWLIILIVVTVLILVACAILAVRYVRRNMKAAEQFGGIDISNQPLVKGQEEEPRDV
ncbi:MAG: hypothetical protein MJ252_11000 [archaeon]|nr:hypothetical protein [archaeon]